MATIVFMVGFDWYFKIIYSGVNKIASTIETQNIVLINVGISYNIPPIKELLK